MMENKRRNKTRKDKRRKDMRSQDKIRRGKIRGRIRGGWLDTRRAEERNEG